MPLSSINPATEEVLATFEEDTPEIVETKLAKAAEAFKTWSQTTFAERAQHCHNVANTLRQNTAVYSEIMTKEMGKTLGEAKAEIEKSAWAFDYYADSAEQMLAPEKIATDFKESYVRFDPIGVILEIMPWNFPFWQVLRVAAPILMGGNVAVLKHASNVPQSAIQLGELFKLAGLPEGVFQTLLLSSKNVEAVIRDKRIRAVSLTGSEPAGREVAKIAGEVLKPVVLELGGSDPFIVLEDADLDLAAKSATLSRIRNNGQSCIAAKRVLIAAPIYDQFLEKLKKEMTDITIGDPMAEATELGPVASKASMEVVLNQVARAVENGAVLVMGGKRSGTVGSFVEPTIITDITPQNPIFNEEIFGPVLSVYKFETPEQLLEIANGTDFGLGASLWTKDIERAKQILPSIQAGCVYVNKVVSSDPRMPFGGVKNSGIGRELSHYGIKEFLNIKSVIIGG